MVESRRNIKVWVTVIGFHINQDGVIEFTQDIEDPKCNVTLRVCIVRVHPYIILSDDLKRADLYSGPDDDGSYKLVSSHNLLPSIAEHVDILGLDHIFFIPVPSYAGMLDTLLYPGSGLPPDKPYQPPF